MHEYTCACTSMYAYIYICVCVCVCVLCVCIFANTHTYMFTCAQQRSHAALMLSSSCMEPHMCIYIYSQIPNIHIQREAMPLDRYAQICLH